MWWKLRLIVYYKFTDESTLKEFLNQSASGEVTGKKADCLRTPCTAER